MCPEGKEVRVCEAGGLETAFRERSAPKTGVSYLSVTLTNHLVIKYIEDSTGDGTKRILRLHRLSMQESSALNLSQPP